MKADVTNIIKIQDVHGIKGLNISYIITFKGDAASKEVQELLKLRISRKARILEQRGLLVTGGLMSNYQKEC